MAPVTRSRNPKPAPEKASAASSSRAKGGKPKPAKGKQPATAAAAEASPSKVQKKNSFKKKGKGKKASSRTSSSSRKPSSKAASPRGSSVSASKTSAEKSIEQLIAPTSEPVEEEEDDEDDFPELTQAYGILPYLDNPQASPLPIPGTPAPFRAAGQLPRSDEDFMASHFARHMANVAQGNPDPRAEADLRSHFAQHMADLQQMGPPPPMPAPAPAPFYPTGHVLRPDEDVLMSQFAHHMVNLPPWARMPGLPPMQPMEVPRGFEAARSPPLFPASRPTAAERRRSSARSPRAAVNTAGESGKAGSSTGQDAVDNHWGLSLKEPVDKSVIISDNKKTAIKKRLDAEVEKRGSSIVARAAQGQAREQRAASASPPAVRKSTRRANGVVSDPIAQVEPETPVSINNAQAFKRPTVANVRRERGQLHDELGNWVQRLRKARDDFDGVIVEIEERMQILKAVNRMQAPLRRAALGRGR